MTTLTLAPPARTTTHPTTAELKQRFAPVFARIAEDSRDRERDRTLGHEAVRLLSESGFTRVRLPVEHGGLGATLPQLIELLVDLGQADSNLPQVLHELLALQHPGLLVRQAQQIGRVNRQHPRGAVG